MPRWMKRVTYGAVLSAVASVLTLAPVSPTSDGGLQMNEACALAGGNCVHQPGWRCVHPEGDWPNECDPDKPDTKCTPPVF